MAKSGSSLIVKNTLSVRLKKNGKKNFSKHFYLKGLVKLGFSNIVSLYPFYNI